MCAIQQEVAVYYEFHLPRLLPEYHRYQNSSLYVPPIQIKHDVSLYKKEIDKTRIGKNGKNVPHSKIAFYTANRVGRVEKELDGRNKGEGRAERFDLQIIMGGAVHFELIGPVEVGKRKRDRAEQRTNAMDGPVGRS